MTRGRRSLIALLQRTSAREVAARCQVVKSCVSEWASGVKTPGPDSRRKLAETYGIAAPTWEAEPARRVG